MVAVLLKTKVQVIDKNGNYKKVSLWSAIKI
jgi:hypothetical protein